MITVSFKSGYIAWIVMVKISPSETMEAKYQNMSVRLERQAVHKSFFLLQIKFAKYYL